MKKHIELRELISIDWAGRSIHGTYHKPFCSGRSKPTLGFLFLNYGTTPRSGGSDVTVYWADSFAKLGYPSFRIDVPGLGDSDGDLPRDMVGYANAINAEHYTAAISAVVKAVSERFHLSGVVLQGQCAGAVAAIFAATASKYVKGLVLITPYFHLQMDSVARTKIGSMAAQNPIGRPVRWLYQTLKRHLRPERLPRNANRNLIRCWNKLTYSELPMLVMTHDDEHRGYFNYIEYLQKSNSNRGQIVVKPIAGHSKEAYSTAAENWLRYHFPVEKDVAVNAGAALG